jgi:hypothetical protein
MSQTGPSKQAALDADLKAIAGVDKYFSNVGTLTIEGASYTPAQLKAVLQAEVDTRKLADQGHATYSGLLADAHAARAKAQDMRKALRAYVLATFGAKAKAMLEDFGMKGPKPRSTSAETKAKAVQSAQATRKARNTLGKKQKRTIKGTQVPATPATPKA